VIFELFLRDDVDLKAYRATSRHMHEIVEKMPGFISLKEYTGEDGEVIDIARFKDETSLEAWRKEPEHLEAQRRGREEFYERYWMQALKVIREYEYRIERGDRIPAKTEDA